MVNWSDGLSVNVSSIDQQHKKWIGMINDLHEAMKQGKGNDVMGKILSGIVDYTKTHFATEERYFKQYNYPDAEAHIKIHNGFVEKVVQLQTDFNKGGLGLSIKAMDVLKDWFVNHIIDKKYSDFFNEKGLS